VEAAVRLVLANVRLQAEDETRMTEVSGSRRRLVEAGDEQRRRLREQLRGGAEATLDDVSRGLAQVVASCPPGTATGLEALADELDAARTDLTSFAQGIHPKALTELGLAAALGDLAVQAVVPVTVRAPQRRFLPSQEAAVFFVCSEALANAAKHAEATQVSIEVTEEGSWLAVRVVDDGRGGADVARGSGLRGLMDRIEALGGRLSIRSPSDEGTRLEARLPLPGAFA
jgi:signal transduction histidine kinase